MGKAAKYKQFRREAAQMAPLQVATSKDGAIIGRRIVKHARGLNKAYKRGGMDEVAEYKKVAAEVAAQTK